MRKKSNLIFGFVFITIFIIVIQCTQNSADTVLSKESHYLDTALSRAEQIQKCASCHKNEYSNWKIGPHANSFSMLVEHKRISGVDSIFPKNYDNFVQDRFNTVCTSCHTGQNIYNKNFRRISHTLDVSKVLTDSCPEFLKQAYSRTNSHGEELETGVDCMTCHAQGQNVVTNRNSKANEKSGIAKSQLFSDNMNCFSCHHHQVSSMKELVTEGKLGAEISCVTCHQQYDEKGKGQHYYYWKNDHETKKRPAHLNIFNTTRVTTEQGQLYFIWKNTIMPHGFSECGEALCIVLAEYKGNKKDTLYKTRINRKDFFDHDGKFPPHFSVGTKGLAFTYNEEIKQKLNLKSKSKFIGITVVGLFKPQYWSAKNQFKEVYKKTYNLQEISPIQK